MASATYPPVVQLTLSKLDKTERLTFESEYRMKSKSKGLMIALAILFPIQLFLLGKVGLGFIFLLTGGGFVIWWVVEIFLTSSRVDQYNGDVATNIVRDIMITREKSPGS